MRFSRILALSAAFCMIPAAFGQIVISQVYGGGGNSGATLKNDFIELFNRGTAPVDLSAWSVQYASSTGTSWQKTNLTGTLQPGHYYLIQQAQGSGGTDNLPTPDATGTIPMSGTAGKVALVNTQTALTGSCPTTDASVQDLVGFGSASNCFEGSGPTGTLSNTTAALRADGGCTDTNSNAADFTVGTPTPRNTASPTQTCSGTPSITITSASPLPNGSVNLPYSFTFQASGGKAPLSWSVTGGTLPSTLTLDSATGTLAGTPTATATLNFTVTVTDANNLTASKSFALTITQPTCTPTHTISQVQGPGDVSPVANSTVTIEGIVTARRYNGFYLQSTGDGDPATSDGIFVFTSSTPSSSIAIGADACVTGPVLEYIPSSDPYSPSLTEISRPTSVTVLSLNNSLPAAVAITAAETNPSGGLSQLEKYEGMRVQVPTLTVVGPTGGSVNETNATSTTDGAFYAVIQGTPRPFREPGVEVPDPLPAGAPADVPRFDTNPERLRIDTKSQLGSTPLDVTTGVTVSGVAGVVDYTYRTYVVVTDPAAPISASSNSAYTPVPDSAASDLTIAGQNLERFYDTTDDPSVSDVVLTPQAYANRLNKASLLIRNVLKTPDILGVEEVENISTLQDIANKVNADAVAAGQPNPNYAAYLQEGNDIGGIDVGFLVKSGKVSNVTVTQYGKDATYTDPSTGQPALLNDRPPLVLKGTATKPDSATGLNVTVIVNHLRSLNSIDDPTDGARVRAKREAQAEYLANLVQGFQAANPTERIVLVGDFNAFQFNDGYVDVIGAIKGQPVPADQVVLASPDLVDPDLNDQVETFIDAEKYSYVFDGNAQFLDHIIVNPPALARFTKIAGGRADADFPESFRNDPTRPERISDHDGLVAYFTLPVTTDLSSSVSLETTPPVYRPVLQFYTSEVTLTNTSGSLIKGPVYVLITGLTPGVTVKNADGEINGVPYVKVASLAVGASGARSVTLRLVAPEGTTITYTPKAVAGTL